MQQMNTDQIAQISGASGEEWPDNLPEDARHGFAYWYYNSPNSPMNNKDVQQEDGYCQGW